MIQAMNKHKRWYSLAMAVIMLAAVIMPGGFVSKAMAATTTLMKFDDFGNKTLNADKSYSVSSGGVGANDDKKIYVVGASQSLNATNGEEGSKNKMLTTNTWHQKDYWETSVTTIGYSDIKLTFLAGSSSTGPNKFQLQYKVEGGEWNNVGTPYVPTNTSPTTPDWNAGKFSFSFPDDADNKALVQIRWVVTDDANGGTAIASSGSSKLNNIVFTGAPIAVDPGTDPGTGTDPDPAPVKSGSPAAGKITFADSNVVSGKEATVAGGADVTVYYDDSTVAGTVKAEEDGSFSLKIENPKSNKQIWITAKEAGKSESDKVSLTMTVNPGEAQYKPGDVVFSQLFLNGGGTGIYKTRFFELYNRTDQDINLDGWAIAYSSSSTSSFTLPGNRFELSGTIKAHGYFLIQTSGGNANGINVPVQADTNPTTLNPSGAGSANTGGIMALFQKNDKAVTSAGDPYIIDLIAYANSDSVFTGKSMYWGAPFVASDIANGVIVRKTDACSDAKYALGMGNGCFTQDSSKDLNVLVPKIPAQPDEIIIKNTKYKEAPDASNIQFVQSGTEAAVTGAANSIVAGSTVSAYLLKDGQLTKAGEAPADSNGAFSILFANPDLVQSVFLSFKTGQPQKESMLTRIDAAGHAGGVASIGQLRVNDEAGVPAHLNYPAVIEGVVTSANKLLGSEKTSFYIQDETGGISVIGSADPQFPIETGQKVRVSGKVGFRAGMTLLIASSIEDLNQQGTMTAIPVTPGQLNSYASAEPLEGRLVSIAGKVTNIPSAASDNSVTLTVSDSQGGLANVKIAAGTKIDVGGVVKLNENYTFTGILAQFKTASPYNSGYEVLPRDASDIKGDLTLKHDPINKAYVGLDLSFTAVARYADSVTLYYKGPEDTEYSSTDMSTADSANYNAKVSGGQVKAGTIRYYIVARSGDKTQSAGTPSEPITVVAANKTDGPTFSEENPANGSQTEMKRPVISVSMSDPLGVDLETVRIRLDGTDYTDRAAIKEGQIKLTLTDDLQVGPHTVTVTAKDTIGNPTSPDFSWTFEVLQRFTGGNHYMGTTHNHTNISHDAVGDPEDALKAAKAHQYDWFAFSDHSHDIDAGLLGQDTVERKNGLKERKGGSDWQLTKQLAHDYTKNGDFVVFPAFEMTSTTWGHSNVFGTENFIDRKEEGGIYQDLQKYYAWVLTYDDIVAQFNHPDMSKNAFDNFIPYNMQLDRLFTMLEVGNGSGKYSYVNAEKKFFSALDLGWHVAPTYGEDNHDATWGQTNKRTVIVSKDLSQDSLLDAMRKMRVYFTEDKDFKFDVLASDFYMGSITDTKQLNFKISGTSANSNVTKVEIVTNGGKVIDSKTMNTKNLNWEPDPINAVGSQQWYVVRATLANGAKAYSSPVWTPEEAVSVKVSNVEAVDGAMIATFPAALQAGIANLGSRDVTNLKAKFYYDSVDDNHFIAQASIEALQSNKSATVTVNWPNPVEGSHRILVKLEAEQDVGEVVFEQPFMIKAPLGIRIMIDGSRNNENTSPTGTIKMSTFTNMMRQEAYTVMNNTAPLTADLLNNVDILVVTNPSTAYSEGETAAVRDFIKSGKSLLLTGKSNFNGSNQTPNSLLSGIGSSILINNDGVFDESDKGNFWTGDKVANSHAVRPHPTPMDNYLTDFVQALDYFSGSSLVKNDGGTKAKLTDNDKVTILVQGNDTSFQSNILGDGLEYNKKTIPSQPGNEVTGGTQIPLAAVEQLDKGRVFVTAMNLFNDKQMDQSFEPKGNVPFVHNIVNWLAHREPVVTPIGAARQKQEDTGVVVQGTVTSAGGVFFDAFYVQDETGGIMAFNQVPDNLKEGDNVRIYGHIKIYENNLELEIGDPGEGVIAVKSGGTPLEPKVLSTAHANMDANQGQLVKVTGKVKDDSKSNEASPSYVINDGSGDLLVFVDGYIINQSGPIPKLMKGEVLQVVGYTAKAASGTQLRVGDTKLMSHAGGAPEKSSDATLSGIKLDGISLGGFAGGTYSYKVELPTGTTAAPTVAATATDTKATVEITQAASMPGMAKIAVTAEDGTTKATYTISFTVKSTDPGSGSGPDPNPNPNPDPNPNPNPDPNPDPSPEPNPDPGKDPSSPNGDNGGKPDPGSVTIKPEMLGNGPEGKATVEVQADARHINLPPETRAMLGQRSLELKTDNWMLDIPAALIAQLSSGLSIEEWKNSTLTLLFDPVDESVAKGLLAKQQSAAQADIRLGGEVYELKLTVTTTSGKTVSVSQFEQPVILRLKADRIVNPKLAGIFYISDEGTTLEYVGGEYSAGYMTAKLSHFSKYAVIEYTKQFADVPSGHWASDVIQQLAAKQTVSGTSATRFEPERPVTRAEFTALLVRALKLTEVGPLSFTDVKHGDWYEGAISIAVKAGIVHGKNSSIFAPDAQITREEMVAMMMRAYEAVKLGQPAGNSVAAFADATRISPWAAEYVNAAVRLHLIQGRAANKFDPQGITTRAEAAQAIYNLLKP